MFSPLELVLLAIAGAGLGLIALKLMRPSMQRAIASAPPEAFRTEKQRVLHWASMLFLLPPLLYVFGVDGTYFAPVFAVLFSQVAILTIMRVLGLGYIFRLTLLPLVAIASIVFGAVVFAWPMLQPEALAPAPWLLLGLSATSLAMSSALSIYSFPKGFGERKR